MNQRIQSQSVNPNQAQHYQVNPQMITHQQPLNQVQSVILQPQDQVLHRSSMLPMQKQSVFLQPVQTMNQEPVVLQPVQTVNRVSLMPNQVQTVAYQPQDQLSRRQTVLAKVNTVMPQQSILRNQSVMPSQSVVRYFPVKQTSYMEKHEKHLWTAVLYSVEFQRLHKQIKKLKEKDMLQKIEIDSLRLEVSHQQSEMNIQHQKQAQHQEQDNSQFLRINNDYHQLTALNSDLQRKINELERNAQNIQQYQNEIANLQNQNADLQKQLQMKDAQRENELNALKAQLNDQNLRLNQSQGQLGQLEGLRQKIANQQQEIRRLEQNLQNAYNSNQQQSNHREQDLRDQIQNLMNDMNNHRAEWNERENALNDRIQELQEELRHIQSHQNPQVNNTLKLEEQCMHMQTIISRLETEKLDILTQLNNRQQDVHQLQNELNKLAGALEQSTQFQNQNQQMLNENQALQAEIANLQGFKQKYMNLTDQFNSLQANFNQLNNDLMGKGEKLNSLTATNQHLKKDRDVYSLLEEKEREKAKQLMHEKDQLNHVIARLQQSLAAKNQELELLVVEYENLKQLKMAEDGQLVQEVEKTHKSQTNNMSLISIIKKLEEEINAKNVEYTRLNQEIERLALFEKDIALYRQRAYETENKLVQSQRIIDEYAFKMKDFMALQGELKPMMDRIQYLEVNLQNSEASARELEAVNGQLKLTLANFQGVESRMTHFQEHNVQYANIIKDLEAKIKETDKVQVELDHWKSTGIKQEQNISELTKTNASLILEINNLKSIITDQENKIQLLNTQLQDSSQRVDNLLLEIKNMEGTLKEIENERNGLNSRSQRASFSLKEVKMESLRLLKIIRQLEGLVGERNAQVAQLQSENRHLREHGSIRTTQLIPREMIQTRPQQIIYQPEVQTQRTTQLIPREFIQTAPQQVVYKQPQVVMQQPKLVTQSVIAQPERKVVYQPVQTQIMPQQVVTQPQVIQQVEVVNQHQPQPILPPKPTTQVITRQIPRLSNASSRLSNMLRNLDTKRQSNYSQIALSPDKNVVRKKIIGIGRQEQPYPITKKDTM